MVNSIRLYTGTSSFWTKTCFYTIQTILRIEKKRPKIAIIVSVGGKRSIFISVGYSEQIRTCSWWSTYSGCMKDRNLLNWNPCFFGVLVTRPCARTLFCFLFFPLDTGRLDLSIYMFSRSLPLQRVSLIRELKSFSSFWIAIFYCLNSVYLEAATDDRILH